MRVRLHGPAGDFILAEGDNLLGRATDCLLMVNDPRLSRRHACFTLIGAVVRVSDLGSMNGVWVGSQRIVSSIKEVENLSRDAAAESQNVSAATEEQSASMEEIASSSQALAKLAQDLQTAISKFRV